MEATIVLNEQERIDQKMHPDTFAAAKHLFEVNGYLKIENLFDWELIRVFKEAALPFIEFNQEKMKLSKGNLIDRRRYIVNIPFASCFNDPTFYANPVLLPLMKTFLGSKPILSSLGCVVSLPGSTDQTIHADHPPLFEENPHLNGVHPPFAITIAIPLIDIDSINGPTKIWSGSHRTPPINQKMNSYSRHLLLGPVGSCYFWDYRTTHSGGSNFSEEIRPLLYISYTRSWFKDVYNPDRLEIGLGELEKIPQENKHLFLAAR